MSTTLLLLSIRLSLPRFGTLLANSSGSLVEPLKSRNAGRGERVAIKPVDKANQIDRRRNAKMLQMRFRQPKVARTTHINGAYSLRKRCFNVGS